jgi:hypothetical protein
MRIASNERDPPRVLRDGMREGARICAGSSVIAGILMSQPDIGEVQATQGALSRAATANEAEDDEDDAGGDERDRGQL